MRNLLFTCILLIAVSPLLFGKIVDKESARQVAKNFLSERIAGNQLNWAVNTLAITDVTTRSIDGQPALYVFSNHGEGFIIISADDALTPVIGYSAEREFPAKGVSLNFDSFLESYLTQVKFVRGQNYTDDAEVKMQWSKYINGPGDNSMQTTTDVAPLLTVMWNQDVPYNLMCPVDAAGPGGHALTGCVATAMVQIMYYYRYPLQGIGTHSYYAAGYGMQTVNYGATTYSWDEMLDQAFGSSGQTIPAIAELNYHAGVSVSMNYGPDASGAYSQDVAPAFSSHFGYTASQYAGRSGYTAAAWEAMVVEQLDASKPVYYAGQSPDGGHAFVCDGYQITGSTKMFHFNFGWGGQSNGYFTLANPNGFTSQQALVRNIIPGANYPYGCGNHVITTANGSFEDGSSPRLPYDPNTSCTWLIAPADSVAKITLSFTSFEVDPSDALTVYDGENENAPVLGIYFGSNLPAAVSSTGDKMFLKFTSDATNEAKGWTAEYHSTYPAYCGGTVTMTQPYGDFSDGSGSNNYNNNAICKWKIQPPFAAGLTLSFNSFDLEENDQLLVYSTGSSSTLLGTLTGNQIPDPIVSSTGAFLLMFKANGYNTASGFEASYTTANVGTDELAGVAGLSLSPNPAAQYTVVRLINANALDLRISINDMTGKQLYSETLKGSKGSVEKTINLDNFKPGMYLFSLKTEKGTIGRKLIVK